MDTFNYNNIQPGSFMEIMADMELNNACEYDISSVLLAERMFNEHGPRDALRMCMDLGDNQLYSIIDAVCKR